MDYMIDFIEAKYHLAVARRMMVTYGEFPEKRVLVGVINETARAVSRLIRAFTKIENFRGDRQQAIGNRLKYFLKIAPKYLDEVTVENLRKVLEVEKAHKISPVEFTRGNKIIFLIDGKYRVLTVERIGEFVKSVGEGIAGFPGDFRQV